MTPREGTALIFNHDTLHEGLPVTAGVKYILRTEIMFHRVDREMIPDPMSYQTNEDYLSTLALYQKSWELEQGVTACSVSVVLVVAYPRIRCQEVFTSVCFLKPSCKAFSQLLVMARYDGFLAMMHF